MVSVSAILNFEIIRLVLITDNILFTCILQFKFRGIELHRKEFYTLLSLLLAIFLFGVLVNDFVSIISVEMPEKSTQEFTFTVLVSILYVI